MRLPSWPGRRATASTSGAAAPENLSSTLGPAAAIAVSRESARRRVVLIAVLAALGLALWAFHSRQSLVTSIRPWQFTRVLLPTANLQVTPVANSGGTAIGLPVLVYHGIEPNGTDCNVTPETFQDHMSALKAAGYKTLTMAEFRAFIEGTGRPAEQSVLVTFDDGRTDSFVGADPVLARLGMHASMFSVLANTHSGKAFYLTEPETAMMARTGRWDVQSHTADSHVLIPAGPLGDADRALATRQWLLDAERLESDDEYLERVTADLRTARNELARLTGEPVIALAFPWGDHGALSFDPLIRERLPAIAASIYPLSFRQVGVTIDESYNYPSDRGDMLRRIYITSGMSATDLLKRLDQGRPKKLPFRERTSFGASGWALTSGVLTTSPHGRALASATGGRSTRRRAEAFLDGSRVWQDYAIRARFSLRAGDTVSFVARRAGPGDYIAATISSRYASIEQVVDNRRVTLAEADVDLGTGPGSLRGVSFRVDGLEATLEIDGWTVARTRGLDPALARGGLAVRIDPAAGAPANLDLAEFEVVPLGPAEVASAAASTLEIPGKGGEARR